MPDTKIVSAELEGTIDDLPVEEAPLVYLKVVIEVPDDSEAYILDSDGNV